ncbi:DUF4148 domain-containing protein [Paraburkholderia sp. J67]|uniref:DUF4148 domain-containing protein n=1 Tax=Paraburkholderia sp. J67 TaxID=2805435 RepID=UPI002ABD521E|nr:DUF4148 domain-containing protein [Paraburkholderia sp. J67]
MYLQRGIKTACLSGVMLASSVAFAQSQPTTNYSNPAQTVNRAEVRQQVIDLKAVGYRPENTSNALYPDDALEAQRRLACKQKLQSQGVGETEWKQRCNIGSTITLVNP